MKRPTTPFVTADPLICSEFHRGVGYVNWRPKGSGDWLLIQTCAGAGRIALHDRTQRLQPGDIVLYAPEVAQDYRTDDDPGHWHLQWVHFKPRVHWQPWLMWPTTAAGIGMVHTPTSPDSNLHRAFDRMLTAHRLGGPQAADLAMNALEEILIRIHRLTSAHPVVGRDPRVQRAVNHLAAHIAKPFHLSDLAAHCGLSSSRLSHLFQAELGTTPQRFSEKLRLEFAAQLLAQTNLSVAEVAAEVGYEDPLYFSRRYRRAFGHAPSRAGPRKP